MKSMPYLFLTLAMMIVGSSVVFGKVITHEFPVFLASGLRFAIATTILLPVLLKRQNNLFKIGLRHLKILLLMALSGQVIFTVLVLIGLRYTGGIEAGLITSTSPAMMVLAAFVLFRERPAVVQLISVVCVVTGIVIINDVPMLTGAGDIDSNLKWLGNLCMVGSVAGEAFFLLLRKQLPDTLSNLAVTAYLCVLGFVLFLPMAVIQSIGFDYTEVSLRGWICIVYFGAVFTVLAYYFWFKGIQIVPGNVAGMFTAVMPVSAVILSCILLRESLALHHLAGGVLILAAIFVGTNPDILRSKAVNLWNRRGSLLDFNR